MEFVYLLLKVVIGAVALFLLLAGVMLTFFCQGESHPGDDGPFLAVVIGLPLLLAGVYLFQLIWRIP